MGKHVLICGLGSIGRRHLRHFRALGAERVDAYRTGTATLSDEGQPLPDHVYHDLGEALAERPGIVVVSNPTSMHVQTAAAAIRAGSHVLIEKPLSSRLDGCEELESLAHDRGRTVRVACNLRHHPTLNAVRDLLRSGRLGNPLLMRADFGAYLPEWHRWEDYRISYAARRDLGGGAALTHMHEIDYVLWLLGPIERAHGIALGCHPIGTDVDEACVLSLRHSSGALSALSLSLAQKPATRSLELRCTAGIAACDLLSGSAWARFADGSTWEKSAPEGFDVDETYRTQAVAFLDAIEGETGSTVTINEAIAALRVALTVQEKP